MDDEKRGKFLCELRKEKNMTQQQLGDIIHYTDKAISKWERGFSFPNDPVTLEMLGEIFDVSVEELLYGERRTKTNALAISKAIVKDLKERYKRYRKSVIAIVIFFLLLIIASLLSIYFIFIKDKIRSYSFSADNGVFVTENSSLLLTNELNILNFNKVEAENGEEITNIRLYYKDGKKDIEVFSGNNTDYYIEEWYGYEELNLDKLVDNKVYLEITYGKNKVETLKVDIARRYINDSVFPKKTKNISNEVTNILNKDFEEFLVDEGFEYDGGAYVKEIDKIVIYVTKAGKINLYYYDNSNNIWIGGHLKDEYLLYEKRNKEKVLAEKKIYFDDITECESKNCSSLDKNIAYIKYLKENYEK